MIRKTAVAAVLLVAGAAQAAAAPSEHSIPKGTVVVFVIDGRLPLTAKAGSTTMAHLRDPIMLDGVIVVPAGTHARVIVGGHTPAGGPAAATLVDIDSFATRYGTLPVRVTAAVPVIDSGLPVEATTDAAIVAVSGTYSISIPFPFSLTGDAPVAAYTASAARTPGPPLSPLPRRGRGGAPSPSPSATISASPSASPSPTATPTPTAPEDVLPTPTVTIPPTAATNVPFPGRPTDSPFPIPRFPTPTASPTP